MKRFVPVLGACLIVGGLTAFPAQADPSSTFKGPGVTILDSPSGCTFQGAKPYPSPITVNGLGIVSDVTVTLKGFSHTFPDDVAALVVGPQGQAALLMAGVGGTDAASDLDLTFDDQATGPIPDLGPVTAGTFQPSVGTTACPLGNFPGPGPSGPYTASLSVFNGTDPTGTWRLYVIDTAHGDAGSIAGWRLTIAAPVDDSVPPTTTVTVNPATPNGQNGWYTSPVLVKVSATDDVGGSGVAQTRCEVLPATKPAPTSFDDIPTGCKFGGAGATENTDKHWVLHAASMDATGNKEAPVSKDLALDTRDPSIKCPVSPSVLKPVDHHLRTVTVAVSTSDATSGVAGFTLLSVKSNQKDGGLGQGDVANDIHGWTVGTADTSGMLRAEKFGGTRTYSIKYRATDVAGNAQTCTAQVTV
jgi:hypothetical protein